MGSKNLVQPRAIDPERLESALVYASEQARKRGTPLMVAEEVKRGVRTGVVWTMPYPNLDPHRYVCLAAFDAEGMILNPGESKRAFLTSVANPTHEEPLAAILARPPVTEPIPLRVTKPEPVSEPAQPAEPAPTTTETTETEAPVEAPKEKDVDLKSVTTWAKGLVSTIMAQGETEAPVESAETLNTMSAEQALTELAAVTEQLAALHDLVTDLRARVPEVFHEGLEAVLGNIGAAHAESLDTAADYQRD